MAKDRKPAEVERDKRRVSELYLQGDIQAVIAHKLSLSQPTVSRIIKELIKEWQVERVYNINEYKARELDRIDLLERTYWAGYERSQRDAVVKSKKAIQEPGPSVDGKKPGPMITKQEASERVEGQTGDPRFLEGVMNCIKQRCAIIGVEAPKQIRGELTGKDGAPLNPVDDQGYKNAFESLASVLEEALKNNPEKSE